MPTVAEHIKAAERNHVLALRLIDEHNDECADWAVVMLFYSLVHFGRALIHIRSNIEITDHKHFQHAFYAAFNDTRRYSIYRKLQTQSENARYDCKRYTAEDFKLIRQTAWIPFENWARNHLNPV